MSADRPPTSFYDVLQTAGQGHLLDDFDELSVEQQAKLTDDIQALDLEYINSSYRTSQATAEETKQAPQPVRNVGQIKDFAEEDVQSWEAAGYKLIAEGKVAVLLLAGGQGTRLGSTAPKGCYDIGLPSHKSLFQLQAERLLKLQQLAADPRHSDQCRKPVRWYIMTSPSTDTASKQHFQQHSYFGLAEDQVFFFQQGQLPCLTLEGKIILDKPDSIAKAPDGNGGVYLALARSGALADMQRHGVECIDCFAVDNALIKPASPSFLGYCHSQGSDCGAKVVAKAYPEERVGVFAQRGEAVEVMEYSELDPQEAASTDPGTGELKFGWSNVCMHYFSTAFLLDMAERLQQQGQYHIAKKKIYSKDGPVQGIKLELFIFDTIPMARKLSLMEVPRDSEFAPVKNAPGSASDSPDTARQAILSLHWRWVEAAGGLVQTAEGIEVSPLVSYGGEGLKQLCSGTVFDEPENERLQH